MIIGYLIAVRDVYGFTSRGLSIASLLFAVTGSLLLGEVFAISQACLFLVAAFFGTSESNIITSSDQFTDENFQPTDEQAKRLDVLVAEWAQRKGFLLDTTEINKQIEQLQNEIWANSSK